MVLSELSIRRPVLATVMSLVIVLVGIIAYDRLTVREYPKIDEPVITVETTYAGASADIIESQITQPLEESLAGIEGIDVMTSISRAERSQITVRFRLDARPRRRRLRRARPRRPRARPAPRRDRRAGHRQGRGRRPADHLPRVLVRPALALEVTDYADRFVKDRLQNLPGVADARIFGERATRCGSGSTRCASPPTG